MSYRKRPRRPTGGTVASVWDRDKKRCHLCGHRVALADASRDHMRARSAGGYDKSANYRLGHRDCNTARGDLPVELAYLAIHEAGRDRPLSRQRVVEVLRAALREHRQRYPDET